MDLGAYVQIEDLSKIAAENGINMPRLRGYRLMSQETLISEEEINKEINDELPYIGEDACLTGFTFGDYYISSPSTDKLKKKYLIYNKEGFPIGIHWEKIHGKHRKALKFALKKKERKIRAQYEMFNKYVGRNDILYVHSRTGGYNWYYYYKEILANPGLLDKIDDSFDCSYADYYFQIKPVV